MKALVGTFNQEEALVGAGAFFANIRLSTTSKILFRRNNKDPKRSSVSWFARQNCGDMFLMSKWNQTKTYDFAIERDFGTDYGICCWYTPQLNFTEVAAHMRHHGLQEPDYGYFFHRIPRVI